VLPVRDDARNLAGQLGCLTEQRYEGAWEIVVADNGSTDDSRAVAVETARRAPRVTVIDASSRRGVCHARNEAAAAAKGDLLVFCDSDDEVGLHWLSSLVHAARKFDIVCGALDRDALNQGVERTWRDTSSMPDELPMALDYREYAVSGNCAIWRDVMDSLGGWNESYRACTDVELSWRALRAGKRLGFTADAVVRYRFRRTFAKLARQYFRIGRAEAQLFRDFRGDGLGRDGRGAARAWRSIVVRLPASLFSSAHRGDWVRVTARRLGRLWGSARAGVFFP